VTFILSVRLSSSFFLSQIEKKNKIRLYKVKRTAAGFSIGKVWNIEDVKTVQNIDTNQFCMTLNKAYTWAVERPKEKMTFLAYVVDVRLVISLECCRI
jgi:hypothetical protein